MSTTPSPPITMSRRDISKTVSATKNLRAISMSLARKVRSTAGLSSTEVANQLAKEAVDDVLGAMTPVAPDDLTAIEKNIRRRLYDSLKVLISIGAISRTPKSKLLVWRGVGHLLPLEYLPNVSSVNVGNLKASIASTRARLEKKSVTADQLRAQNKALEILRKRNTLHPASDATRIHLPFVLIRTPVSTEITLDATPDAKRMAFEFQGYYEIVNDSSILDRLFLVKDDPNSTDIEVAKLSLPARVSVPQMPVTESQEFGSPKRRRIASYSPFAKYTSGAKPPPSPAHSMRRRRGTRAIALSPEHHQPPDYDSPLQISLRALAETSSTPSREELSGKKLDSPSLPLGFSSAPPRKRRLDCSLFASPCKILAGNNHESKTPPFARGFSKRFYGPGSPKEETKHIEVHQKGDVDDAHLFYPGSGNPADGEDGAQLLSPGVSPLRGYNDTSLL